MRRGTAIFLVLNLIVLGFLLRAFSTLIALLFEDGSVDAISKAEIPGPSSNAVHDPPHMIPKIIHQTYINSTIPPKWKDGQQSCIRLHDDWEYKLWTDKGSRDFIATEYPWFLETFDSYPYNIQRADTIRYFILTFYGGIYLDLDDGCSRRLDPLLNYPAWARFTTPTGISNDAMGSVPQHPFFKRVIESLQAYNRKWMMPYITVMYSTGPLFLSVIWKEYLQEEHGSEERVRILMPDEYSNHAWSFFNISKGNSWHKDDAKAIFWMGRHWLLLTTCGFAVAGVVGFMLWWLWRTYMMKQAGRSSHKEARPGRGWKMLRLGSRKHEYDLLDRNA